MSHKATNWAHRSKWLWEKTDGHCAYCGLAFTSPKDMTVDHLVPRSKGGGNHRDNRFPCCARCNSRKHNRPLSYLREALRVEVTRRPAFTPAQVQYLLGIGVTLPADVPFLLFWERLGNSFPAGVTDHE